MKLSSLSMPVISGLLAITGSACHTTAHADPVPAILANADDASMRALKSTLAKAMNKSKIELGASDPTQSPNISVLPKSVVGLPGGDYANQALPTQFDLMMDGRNCYVVKRGTETKIKVDGIVCKPFEQS